LNRQHNKRINLKMHHELILARLTTYPTPFIAGKRKYFSVKNNVLKIKRRDSMEQHHHSQHQNGLQNHNLNNEIKDSDSYKDNLITIYIENIEDIKTPIKLIKNHEIFMHLIIVSEDLKDFFHLHPEKVGKNHFEQEINLSYEKEYKAFVDIIVEGKDYVIKPI